MKLNKLNNHKWGYLGFFGAISGILVSFLLIITFFILSIGLFANDSWEDLYAILFAFLIFIEVYIIYCLFIFLKNGSHKLYVGILALIFSLIIPGALILAAQPQAPNSARVSWRIRKKTMTDDNQYYLSNEGNIAGSELEEEKSEIKNKEINPLETDSKGKTKVILIDETSHDKLKIKEVEIKEHGKKDKK